MIFVIFKYFITFIIYINKKNKFFKIKIHRNWNKNKKQGQLIKWVLFNKKEQKQKRVKKVKKEIKRMIRKF